MNALLFGPGLIGGADWLALLLHFTILSLLAIGGAITTVSGMHRFIVEQHGWLSDALFTDSVALAQAAPGPNVLFVAVIGFNVGGLAGVVATLTGTLVPSSVLTFFATRWGARNAEARSFRALTTGLAPLTIGLLLSTGWVLLEPTRTHWRTAVLVAGTLAVMLRTRWSPLWPIGVGALLGAAGWI